MKHPETFIVTSDATSPAGKPGRCLCCDAPVGGEHRADCVRRQRSVVVRVSIEYVVMEPEAWDDDQIAFHRNESAWCADNGFQELLLLHDRLKDAGACLCSHVAYEVVRDATAEDEARDGLAPPVGPEGVTDAG